MRNILIGYMQQPARRAAGKPGDPLRFVASTEDVARDGLVIEAGGWDLQNYRKNPVFLWGHDMLGSRPPIGKADVTIADKRLLADIVFDQDDAFARQIESKYRNGFLNAVSVSWDTKRMEPGNPPRVTKAELLEISGVPVPADPGALAQRGLGRRGALPVVPLAQQPREYQLLVRALTEVFVEKWRAEERHWRELSELVDLDLPRR
jgi:hypothetical protein